MKREKLYKKARLALKAGNGKQAIDLLEKAARLAKASGNLEEAIDLLQEASTIAEDTGDLERRTALLECAITFADSLLDDLVLRAALRNNLAMAQKRVGSPLQARETLRRAIDLLKQVPASVEMGTIWNNLGFIERDLSNLKTALHSHESALAILEQIDNAAGIARTLLELGIVHKDLGHLTEARANFERALTLLIDPDTLRERGHALTGLGLVFQLLHDDQQACHCFEEALTAYQNVNDRENEALVLHNLGQFYDNKAITGEEVEIALHYYRQSLEINQEIGAELGVADDLSSMAALYQAGGMHEQARQMHELVLHMYEKVGFREGQVDTLVNLGILARDMHDFDGAETQMTEALTLAQETGNLRLLSDVSLNRGDLYLLTHRFQEAATDYQSTVAFTEALRSHLLLEEEALGFFDEPRVEVYDRLVRLYARCLSDPKQAQMWVEQAKSREFLRRLRFSELLHAEETPKELLDQEDHFLAQLRQATLALAVPNEQDRLSALRDYEIAERELSTVWTKIELFDQEYVSLRRGEPASWEEVRKSLHIIGSPC